MEQKEFETLIRQIRPKLYAEALRLLTLWTIRQQLEIYRSMEALAVVMVRRLALSRKRVATTIPLSNWQQTDTDSIDSPEDLLISREEETKVIKMISTLPDAQQTVLRMKHIDGLETSEIARITGSSEEAIRQNLSRARKKILKMFMQ